MPADNDTQRVINILESGEVERYHAAPGVKAQTDGLHAWGVAIIADYILGANAPMARRFIVMKEALHHDEGELMTGDVPYTFKRYDEETGTKLRVIEDTVREEYFSRPPVLARGNEAVLKVADTLDGFIWTVKWQTGDNVPGLHRGRVRLRWSLAYNNARSKFAIDLSAEEWLRADQLFAEFAS